MKIEKITKLTGSRCSLIIDSKKHIIYDDVLLMFNIYKPGEITKKVYDDIVKQNAFYEGYEKAIKFINFKMRTVREVRKKLYDLELEKKDIEGIIGKLISQGYLDDKKYLKSYINDQIALTLNGPKKIISELRKKGLKEEDINLALKEISLEVWQDKAEKILNKKLKSARNISEIKFKQKMRYDFLALGYEDIHYNFALEEISLDDSSAYEKDKEKIERKLAKKYDGEKLEYMVRQKLYALGYRR